MGEMINAY